MLNTPDTIVLKENNDVNQIADVRQVIVRLVLVVWKVMNKHEINLNDRNEGMIVQMQSEIENFRKEVFDKFEFYKFGIIVGQNSNRGENTRYFSDFIGGNVLKDNRYS
jgi:hypothetical protein